MLRQQMVLNRSVCAPFTDGNMNANNERGC
jgi:hypothetical protein